MMNKLLILFIIFLQSCSSFSKENNIELRRAHDALFYSFLPKEKSSLSEAIFKEGESLKETLWTTVSSLPHYKEYLSLLSKVDNLQDLRTINKLSADFKTHQTNYFSFVSELRLQQRALSKLKTNLFSELSRIERDQVIQLYLGSRIIAQRKVVSSLKSLYVRTIYGGKLGFMLSKAKLYPLHFSQIPDELPLQLPKLSTHLSYNKEDNKLDGEIDYIIVGAGSSGSLIADELSRVGKKVLLIERGSFALPGAFEGRLQAKLLENSGARLTDNGSAILINGEAVGGGTAVNGDVVMSPSESPIKDTFKRWEKNNQIKDGVWSLEKIKKAESWVSKKLSTRKIKPEEVIENSANWILEKGAKENGLDTGLYLSNTYEPNQWKYKISGKISATEAFLIDAITRQENPVTLLSDSSVEKVLMSENKAIGVEIVARKPWNTPGVVVNPYGFNLPENQKVKIFSKNVILAAGALGSPAILLKSNVPHKNMIGRGLVFHPTFFVTGLFDFNVDMTNPYISSPQVHFSFKGDHRYNSFLGLAALFVPGNIVSNMAGSGEQIFDYVTDFRKSSTLTTFVIDKPQLRNRVYFDQEGKLQVHYSFSKRMRRSLAKAMSESSKILLKAGAKKVLLPTDEDIFGNRSNLMSPSKYVSDIEEAELISKNLKVRNGQSKIYGLHAMGTNKMGTSPLTSVVNSNYQVWNTKGLYVADASVFPESVGSHPMQAIYVIAKIFVDGLLTGDQ